MPQGRLYMYSCLGCDDRSLRLSKLFCDECLKRRRDNGLEAPRTKGASRYGGPFLNNWNGGWDNIVRALEDIHE